MPCNLYHVRESAVLNVFIISIFIQNIFFRCIPIGKLDGKFSQIDDVLLITLLFTGIIHTLNKKASIYYSPLLIPFIFIFSLFVFSAISNTVPYQNVFLSAKHMFSGFAFYFIIVNNRRININNLNRSFKLIKKLLICEVFIQIIQFTINLVRGTINDDVAMGTFSSANTIGYAYFFVLFPCAYSYLVNNTKKDLLYCIIYIVGMLLSFGQFSILMFPILFFVFTFHEMWRRKRLLLKISLSAGLFVGLFAIISILNNMDNRNQRYGTLYLFNPKILISKLLIDEFNVYSGSARMLWFPITYDRISQYAFHPLVGMGPGMYASFASFKNMSAAQKSIYNVFGQIEKGFDPYIDSLLIPLWGELGYLGISIFIIVFLLLSIQFYRYYLTSCLIKNREIHLSAAAGSIYFLIGFYFSQILFLHEVSHLFFFLIGLSVRVKVEELHLYSQLFNSKLNRI